MMLRIMRWRMSEDDDVEEDEDEDDNAEDEVEDDKVADDKKVGDDDVEKEKVDPQSKCTWTCHNQEPCFAEIYKKNAAPESEHPDQAPFVTLTVRTPQCGHTIWEKSYINGWAYNSLANFTPKYKIQNF